MLTKSNEEVHMRIAFAVLASTVTMALALPALAQGFAGCPPGLAMKGDGCLPPGHAKKMKRGYDSRPISYARSYPDYSRQTGGYPDYSRQSGASLNIGVTLPLQ
jgi:hypothetical protein